MNQFFLLKITFLALVLIFNIIFRLTEQSKVSNKVVCVCVGRGRKLCFALFNISLMVKLHLFLAIQKDFKYSVFKVNIAFTKLFLLLIFCFLPVQPFKIVSFFSSDSLSLFKTGPQVWVLIWKICARVFPFVSSFL